LVWVPAGSFLPQSAAISYDSATGIGTVSGWTVATGLPSDWMVIPDQWGTRLPVAADPTNTNVFYLFHAGTGMLYTSSNGGVAWKGTATGISTISTGDGNEWWLNAVPGTNKNTELYVAVAKHGLWKSSNAGAAFAKLSAVSSVTAFAVSGRATSPLAPQLLLLGEVNSGSTAFYLSMNRGSSWSSVGMPIGIITNPDAMTGDDWVSTRFYLTSGGGGVYGLNITGGSVADAVVSSGAEPAHQAAISTLAVIAICLAAILVAVAVVLVAAVLLLRRHRQELRSDAAAADCPFHPLTSTD